MKKIFAFLMAVLLTLSVAACAKTTAPPEKDIIDISQSQEPAPAQQNNPAQPQQAEPSEPAAPPSGAEVSAWLQTKTGRFYSQFASGKVYMEYEMEADGATMSVISASSGGKTYSETSVNGENAGMTIMDGEYVYVIDHASKMIIKMSLQSSQQQSVDTVISEDEVDPAQMVTGTREIGGKTYDTEEWNVDGAKSILCFDGDDLAYIVGEYDGEETAIKIVKFSDKVDESVFELPEGYETLSY